MDHNSALLCNDGQDCAIVFARNPLGRVKSRLAGHLTPEQRRRLHCACANDTMALLDQCLPRVDKWLFLSEPPATDIQSIGLCMPAGFGWTVQQGNDLGERLGGAFSRAFAGGARRVVIFGSDSPTLRTPIVQQAFDMLSQYDSVLGPTEDGGYYLIGCRRFDARLFEQVEWSTPRTFQQTRSNAEQLGYAVGVLDAWFDLDEWKDVERVLAEYRLGMPLPAHLAGFLSELEQRRNRYSFSHTASPSRTGRMQENRSGEE